MANEKQHAHELIERLPSSQLTALVNLLETMLDPAAAAIANAPMDDEPETEQERQAVAEARKWLSEHPAIPMQTILEDFGLTMDEFRKLAETAPAPPADHG